MAGGQMQQQRTSTAVVTRPEQGLKTFTDPAAINEWLAYFEQIGYLVSPATACGRLPPGCSVAITAVRIDAERETYPIQGKPGEVGIQKVGLVRIGAAAAATWDLGLTGRIGEVHDPRLIHYRAACYVKNFDTSVRLLSGEVILDYREGSDEVIKIREREEKKARELEAEGKTYFGDYGDTEIRQIRSFLIRLAESKAKNRALRELGVRTSYVKEELKEKSFFVASLMFTAHSDNPETQRIFDLGVMGSMLGANAALFGAPAAQRVLGAAVDVTPRSVPMQVAPTVTSDDELPPRTEPRAAQPSSRAANAPRQQSTGAAPNGGAIDTTKVFMPGRGKGMVSEASDKDLDYWWKRLGKDLQDGTVQADYRDRTERQFAAIEFERAKRKAPPEGAADAGSPAGAQPGEDQTVPFGDDAGDRGADAERY